MPKVTKSQPWRRCASTWACSAVLAPPKAPRPAPSARGEGGITAPMPGLVLAIKVKEGDLLYFNTWGGGGWGDPFKRDPELVRLDVDRRLVTRAGARRYGVVIGDDVAIGANTTVDRGSLRDTVIGDGVRLDNLIQVGHNVTIGEHTAAAAFVGISGSTEIGCRCTLGGSAGFAGHLTIGDDVHVTGMAMVTHSLREPGAYSSGIPAIPSREWRRNVARFQHLDELARRVKALEERLAATDRGGEAGAGN
mgnify:CR=1 FL=1